MNIDVVDIVNDHVVDSHGRFTRVYRMTPELIAHFSAEQYKAYLHKIGLLLHSLNRDFNCQIIRRTTVHSSDSFYDKQAYSNDIQALIFDDHKHSIRKHPYFKQDMYLFVTYNPERQRDIFGRQKQFVLSDQEQIQHLDHNEVTSLHHLNLYQLKRDDIYRYCFSILNPTKSRYATPEYRSESELYLSDQLCHSPINNSSDYIELDGCYSATIVMHLLPKVADLSFISALNFSCHSLLSFSFEKAHNNQEINRLTLKRNIIGSTSTMVQDIFGAKTSQQNEVKGQQSIDDISSVIEKVSLGEQDLFHLRFCLSVVAESKEELNEQLKVIESHLQNIQKMQVKQDRYNHLENYMSCLPGQYEYNKSKHLLLTDALAILMPLQGTFEGTEHEEVILRSYNNERIALSLSQSNLSSAHSIVLAPTGKGKSFTVNYLLQQFMSNTDHTHITIVDRGGSYKKSCVLNNGQYLSLDLDKNYAINCFPKRDSLIKFGEIDKELLVYLRQFICLCIAEEVNQLRPSQEQLIEKSIVRFYEQYNDEEPILSEYLEYLDTLDYDDSDEIECIKSLKKALLLYCDDNSAYEVLLNQRTQLNINNRFVVFDITQFKQHPRLERLYFFLINKIINEKMHDLLRQNHQQLVIFDEAWKVLQSKDSAQMVETLYREARRYGTKICCISHSGKDFTQNEHVNIIPLNSEIKLILAHDTDKIDELQGLGLHDSDFNWITSIKERRDVFCKFGQQRFVFTVNASNLMTEICRTDAESIHKYQFLTSKDARPQLIKELKNAN